MKKLLILSIAMFSLFSCSSDDDNIDPLVGTWTLFSTDNVEVNDCEKKTTATINENNTLTSINYSLINNECVMGTRFSRIWENKGNNIYNTKSSDGTEEFEATIIFSNNNNTFTQTSTENGNVVEEVHNKVN